MHSLRRSSIRLGWLAFISLAIALLLSSVSEAAEPEIFTGRSNLALKGYDTVAYFEQGEAVKGNKDLSSEHKGATWTFSSTSNKALFDANPEGYMPQYGGYCAWAMAQGNVVKSNPKVWYIEDGLLYLNVSKGIQKKWLANMAEFIEQADANWPGALE